MKIVVIDGQGGKMGCTFIERWKKQGDAESYVMAVGTNSIATSAMLKSGADAGATGENPVRVAVRDADYVVGPIGILAADAMYGEITPEMAKEVGSCKAQKILFPFNTCDYYVLGVSGAKMNDLCDEAIRKILSDINK